MFRFLQILLLTLCSCWAQGQTHWANDKINLKKALKLWHKQGSKQKSKNIIIAVIDTGIDLSHKKFKKHLWRNPGESGLDAKGRNKATNKIDDDRNGLIDDVHGWNFANNNNQIVDHNGHGTHISGIITQTAPEARLMVLNYYNPNSFNGANVENTLRAIRYAVHHGAHIINYSSGGREASQSEKQAVELARKKGVLFVAAAGNESQDTDTQAFYPASYDLDNILSVTAIDRNSKILLSSNWGIKNVDVAAPGQNIISPSLNGGQVEMTGTSQATAFVSGLAALLMAGNSTYLKPQKVIHQITRTSLPKLSLFNKTRFSAQIEFYRALTMKSQGVSVTGDEISQFGRSPDSIGAPSLEPLIESAKQINN